MRADNAFRSIVEQGQPIRQLTREVEVWWPCLIYLLIQSYIEEENEYITEILEFEKKQLGLT